MSFDLISARRAFEEYLNEYDREDEKIKQIGRAHV